MTKKIGMFLVMGLFCVSFVGCGKEVAKTDDANQGKAIEHMEKEMATKTEKMVEKSGIAGLLEKGDKIKCEYKIETGDDNATVLTYIDGEKFKTESNMGGIQAVSIFDGESYYSWTTGKTKQGSKIDKRCMEEMEAETMGDEMDEDDDYDMTFGDVDDIVAWENDMQMNCSKTGNIDWTIPTDIKFIDTCKMMENMENQTQNMEQIQKDMEQMQKDMGM